MQPSDEMRRVAYAAYDLAIRNAIEGKPRISTRAAIDDALAAALATVEATPVRGSVSWLPMETVPADRDIFVTNPITGPYRTRRDAVGNFPLCGWDGKPGLWYPVPTGWLPLESLPPLRVPDGWRLVPIEMSPEMVRATMWALDRWREKNGDVQAWVPRDQKYQIRWAAQLAAAPRYEVSV